MLLYSCYISMLYFIIHYSYFIHVILHMNDKKCPGYDAIRAKDIKYASTDLVPVITHLINQCIATSTYPDIIKIGVIRPIYKKGKRNDYNNYRPITILSCVDKIIERYFENKINKFLNSHSIITSKQYGFQKNKSTTELLRKFSDEVNSYLNDRQHVLVLLIDFSKAFDVLNYNILFDKLSRSGIQGPLLELLKNYHHNRYTTVKICNHTSDLILTTQGTAQGSILGPTEYLLYVNDMVNVISEGSVYQFADDTCLLVARKKVEEAQKILQQNFNQLCKWAHDVGLIINYQKTKYLHIHSSHNIYKSVPTIVAHNHLCLHSYNNNNCSCDHLELVKKHMYVGLMIDDRFSWGPHTEHVCSKLRSVMSKLKILKYKLPYKTLRLLYMALADSVIGYGLSSYGRTCKTNLDDIYNLQIRILKIIVPKKIKIICKGDYGYLFEYCNVMNIYDKIKFSMLSEIHNPNFLSEKTRLPGLRNLNECHKYILPKVNNNYGARTDRYLIPSYLNELPIDLQEMYTHQSKYRSKLKKYYIDLSTTCKSST